MKLIPKRDEYKTHGKFLGWGSGPDADWRVMFTTFLVLLFLVVVYSGLAFYQVWQGVFSAEIVETADSPININLLKRNTEYYKSKQAVFDSILNTPETTPDPSS